MQYWIVTCCLGKQEFFGQFKVDYIPDGNWLWRWRKRHNINHGKIHGESAECDEIGANDFVVDIVPGLLKDYDLDNTYF